MGKALYRKYRSKSLSEIVGQPHITATLTNALKSGDISHAYLFTGPRGVGKTSIARILAHEVNHLEYTDDTSHLDIIEIDGASNRRIDEIRELRERVHTAPTSAQYKVYIIDEVHMLTKEAFNALLKTLEEPPAHVIFILATTEAHKLPETIISRTQRYSFKPVSMQQVVDHLRYISDQEKIVISNEALQLIARHGDGSFRDSISLLDQVRGHGGSIELSHVQKMLGIAPTETIDSIIQILQSGSAAQVMSQIAQCRDQGYQPAQIAKQIAARLRQYILEGTTPIHSELLTPTLKSFMNVPAAYDPQTALEIALLDITLATKPLTQTTPEKPTPTKPAPALVPVKKTPKEPVRLPKKPDSNIHNHATPLDKDSWQEILTQVKKTHNTLYSVARMATPQINGQELTLVFEFEFHQKRLNESKNKQVISTIAKEVLSQPINITCTLGTASAPPTHSAPQLAEPTLAPQRQNDTLSTISNIFGGAEVIE